MAIPNIKKADEKLKDVLKPKGGGWLDVQEALWDCYRARKNQKKLKQIGSKFIPWYEGLWKSNMPSPVKDYKDLVKILWYPTLNTLLVNKKKYKYYKALFTKAEYCRNCINQLCMKGRDYFERLDEGTTESGKLATDALTWSIEDFYDALSVKKSLLKCLVDYNIFREGLGLDEGRTEMIKLMLNEVLKTKKTA